MQYGPPPGFPPKPPRSAAADAIRIVLAIVGAVVAINVAFLIYYGTRRYKQRSEEAVRYKQPGNGAKDQEQEEDTRPGSRASSNPTSAPTASSGVGLPITLDLGEQGFITLPAGSTLIGRDVALQENQALDYVYRLKGHDGPFIVFTSKPDGVACAKALQTNLDKTRSIPPGAEALFRVDVLEKRKLGDMDSVYSEIGSRSPKEAKTNTVYHPGVGILLCGKTAMVNLTLRGDGPILTDTDRADVKAIAMSLRAP